MGLLRWLATSQAADDINSDDELLHETILSPLFPATNIEEVLEKANMDYESESQKECQDILDSIADFNELKDLPGYNHSPRISSEKIIPQVDGAGDDMLVTSSAGSGENFSEMELKSKFDEACEHHILSEDTLGGKKVLEDAQSSITHKRKRKKLFWGSLPFTINQESKIERDTVNPCGETEVALPAGPLSDYKVGQHEDYSLKNVNSGICDVKETTPLVECSVRDLMRRKRHHRVEPVECSSLEVEKVSLEKKEKEDTKIIPKHLDFEIHCYEPNGRYASTAEDGNFGSHKSDNNDGSGVFTTSGNFLDRRASDVHISSSLSKPGNTDSETATGHHESDQESDVQLLKPDPKENTFADAATCFRTTVGHDELGVKNCPEGRPSEEWAHEMSSKKPVVTNRSNISVLNSRQSHREEVSMVNKTDQQYKDLISLSFCKKPPIIEWIDSSSRKAFSCPVISYLPCPDKESHDGTSGCISIFFIAIICLNRLNMLFSYVKYVISL